MEKLKTVSCWFYGKNKRTNSAEYTCIVAKGIVGKSYIVDRYFLTADSRAHSEGGPDGVINTTVRDVFCFKREVPSESGLYYKEFVCSYDIEEIAVMDDGSKDTERLGYTLDELNKVKAYGEL